MRVLKMVVALLLTVAGVAACGLFGGPSKDDQIRKILNDHPTFVVFLRPEATAAQRTRIEAALRALPGFRTLTFSDHEAAYQRMKQEFSADPSSMPDIEPDALPESYEVRMKDIDAVRAVRDDQAPLQGLPGVQDLIFTCLTVPECRQRFSPHPTTTPS